MTSPRALDKTEFLACFEAPMRDVTETSSSAAKVRAYIAALDLDGAGLTLTGAVAKIYRDAGDRFDQVLMATEERACFLVIIVDLGRDAIHGHRVLDLNREYGVDQDR